MKLILLLKTSLISVVAISGLITSAHANNFNYNYAQIGYSFINDFDVDEGVTVSGSYDINENINILGDYFVSTSTDSKIADDIDVDIYSLGIGYHTPVSDKTDVLAEIGLFNTSTDATARGITINQDDSGYKLAVGARYKLNEKIEINARGDHRNSDDLTDNTFTLGTRYSFTSAISAGLDFNTGADDGSELITSSLRWNFK